MHWIEIYPSFEQMGLVLRSVIVGFGLLLMRLRKITWNWSFKNLAAEKYKRFIHLCDQMVTSVLWNIYNSLSLWWRKIIRLWIDRKWNYFLILRVNHLVSYWHHGWQMTSTIPSSPFRILLAIKHCPVVSSFVSSLNWTPSWHWDNTGNVVIAIFF